MLDEIPNLLDLFVQEHVSKDNKFFMYHKTSLKKVQYIDLKLREGFDENGFTQMKRSYEIENQKIQNVQALPNLQKLKGPYRPQLQKWTHNRPDQELCVQISEDMRIPELLLQISQDKINICDQLRHLQELDKAMNKVQRETDVLEKQSSDMKELVANYVRMGYFSVRIGQQRRESELSDISELINGEDL